MNAASNEIKYLNIITRPLQRNEGSSGSVEMWWIHSIPGASILDLHDKIKAGN